MPYVKTNPRASVLRSIDQALQRLERLSARCDWTADLVDRFLVAHSAMLDIRSAVESLSPDFAPPERRSEVVGRYVRPFTKHAAKYFALETSQPIFPAEGLRVIAVLGTIAVIELASGGEIRAPLYHFEMLGGFHAAAPKRATLSPGQRVVAKEAYSQRYLDDAGESIFPPQGLRIAVMAGTMAVLETDEARIHIPAVHLQVVAAQLPILDDDDQADAAEAE